MDNPWSAQEMIYEWCMLHIYVCLVLGRCGCLDIQWYDSIDMVDIPETPRTGALENQESGWTRDAPWTYSVLFRELNSS